MQPYRVERRTFRCQDAVELVTYEALADGQPARGLIFLPSLVGGSYLEQFEQFSRLTASGYSLFTFHYRGHRYSSGSFDLTSCVADTVEVLRQLRREQPALPFYAIATCFGSIPALSLFSVAPGFFERLVIVNAILDFHDVVGSPLTLLRTYGLSTILASFREPGRLINAIRQHYFPEINGSSTVFGALDLGRVHFGRVFRSYLRRRPAYRARKVTVPTLCLLGTNDRVLKFDDAVERRRYLQRMHSRFGALSVIEYAADHSFLSFRGEALDDILGFLAPAAAGA